MALFDIVAAIVLALSLIYSMVRGMVRELFALLAYIGGYFVAIHFQKDFAVTLRTYISNPSASEIVSFALIFIATLFGISLLGKVLQKLVHSAPGLSGLDRILGGAIGIAKAIILLIILMFPLRFFPDISREITRDSIMAPKLVELSKVLGQEIDTEKIIDKIPDFDLKGVKEKIEDFKGVEKLTDSIKTRVGKTETLDQEPQENYTPEDESKLNDILLSLDKK